MPPILEEVIVSIIETVKSQAQTIKTITEKPNERLVTNTKDISEINGSVITVERYSRKTCLLISNIDLNLSPVANVLSLINDTLKIGTKEIDLVASHTVNGNRVAPIIVKFLYYKHRDLEWVRRTWRMHIKHSLNKPAFRGILCPGNRSVQAEEREKERERKKERKKDMLIFLLASKKCMHFIQIFRMQKLRTLNMQVKRNTSYLKGTMKKMKTRVQLRSRMLKWLICGYMWLRSCYAQFC